MSNYSQEDFLEIIDDESGDQWIGTHVFARRAGCTMGTANRWLLRAAHDGEIDVYDPEETAAVDADSIDEGTSRLLGFRRPPDNPEDAPDYLHTGVKQL